MFRSLRLASVALLGLVAFGVVSSAQAGGYGGGYGGGHGGGYGHQPAPCYYKEVISYKIISEPYVKYIKIYDAYGCEKIVPKTFYREIQVPVKSYVKVCH